MIIPQHRARFIHLFLSICFVCISTIMLINCIAIKQIIHRRANNSPIVVLHNLVSGRNDSPYFQRLSTVRSKTCKCRGWMIMLLQARCVNTNSVFVFVKQRAAALLYVGQSERANRNSHRLDRESIRKKHRFQIKTLSSQQAAYTVYCVCIRNSLWKCFWLFSTLAGTDDDEVQI